MTATFRFRGRKKPASTKRISSCEIESETVDADIARALHIRAIQKIRRQVCSTMVEEPEPLQEPTSSLLRQNFRKTTQQISHASLNFENYGQKRPKPGHCEDIPKMKIGEAIKRQRKVSEPSCSELSLQEFDLSLEEKLQNIEATETAKQAAMKQLTKTSGREIQIQGPNLIPVNVGCNFQQFEKEPVYGNIRYAASDELAYQQFRNHVS